MYIYPTYYDDKKCQTPAELKRMYEDMFERQTGDNESWVYHPNFPLEDWQEEVANNDTIVGYWEWVFAAVDLYEPDARDDG